MKKRKQNDIELKNQVIQSGGLIIGENVSVDVRKKYIAQRFLLWIVAFCGIIGEVLSITSLFALEYDTAIVMRYLVLAFFVTALVFSVKKHILAAFAEIAVMVLVLIKLPKDDLYNGFKCFVNQVVQRASLEKYGVIEFYISRKVDEFECLTLFMAVLAVLTVFLVMLSVLIYKSFALGFVFTFPLVEIGLFFGIAPNYIHFAFLLAFWIALVVLNNSNYKEYVGSDRSDFVRKGNSFMPKHGMKRKVDGVSSLCCLTVSLILFLSVAVVVQILDVERPESIDQIRYTLKHDLTEKSLEEIINDLTGNDESSKSNHGNLKNNGNLEFENEDMLKVLFSSKIHNNIYLKGYVGSVYDGDNWLDLNEDDYEELSDIMDVFSNGGYFPQDRLFRYLRSNYEMLPVATVDVDIINASTEFCYTPYAMTVTENMTYLGDSIVYVDGDDVTLGDVKASYNYQFTPANLEQYLSQHFTNSDISYQTNDALKEYNSFCKKVYTRVPFDESINKLYDKDEYAVIFDSYQNGELNTYETLCEIRELIQSKADYTLSPGKTPADTDFVYYFLEENNKGYCVHYATAGIILARMAGIPARYATGYVVDNGKFNILSQTQDGYEFVIQDDSAHAWAEVYIDGMGWVPFEFTEGYSSSNAVTTRATTTTTTAKKNNTTTTKSTNITTNNVTTTATSPLLRLDTDDSDDNISKMLKCVVLILCVILLFALIVVAVIHSHTSSIEKRRKDMNTDSANKNAVNAYRYLVALLEYYGVEYSNQTPLEFADKAENECDLVNGGEIVSACYIAMLAGYGNTGVNVEQAHNIVSLSESLAKRIYYSKSKAEKLKMKYIEHLI